MEAEESVSRALELAWGWKLWRAGLVLCAGPLTLASLRDLPPTADSLLGHLNDEDDTEHPYANIKYVLVPHFCHTFADLWIQYLKHQMYNHCQ